jgi:16S rRNA (guanine527-N7)-methyltransferase
LINSSLRTELKNRVYEASSKIGIAVSSEQNEKLIQYLELLIKWNKAYNLTAIRDPEEMFIKHIVDSLSIAPFIKGESILDVGTGPGLPGIPMAIMFPSKHFSLLDSNGKKTRFLIQAKMSLALANIEVFNVRVENLANDKLFDQIMSRAFTALDNMVLLCKHLLSSNGEFLAMKGLIPKDEMAMVDTNYEIASITPLTVPGCLDQRHLLIVKKKSIN